MKKHSLVRTIYLYLFTLVGLALLIISGVRFLDMGLKAFIFTKAEEEERLLNKQPLYPPIRVQKIAEPENEILEPKQEEIKLSQEEKNQIA